MDTVRPASFRAVVLVALAAGIVFVPSASFGQPSPAIAPPATLAPQAEVKTPSTTQAPPEAAPSLSGPPAVEPLPVLALDRYFVIVFGSESVPKRGKYTHTWFSIVKATPNLDAENTYKLEVHTISWLPSSLNIRVLKLRPDCGVNLDLHRTIQFVRSCGECVALWGPYELNPTIAVELYNKTLKQIARLNSGRVLYKAVDPDAGPRSTYISNCIHAVTDLDGLARRSGYSEIRNNGFDASANLARVMTGSGRVDWTVTHDWLIDALDLTKYRIQQRSLVPRAVAAPLAQPQVAPASN
ncbi:MAG: hypothetical protein C0483_01345 [Pirellula sp.]|nr:hypothetical protein [Pirellula sp.]